ncbi:MAG: ABC transporter ATP-binding protein [Peptostreptococcaceae bacterium]|nr:ABC transporter ATP-binding protein [Peptostreptococcaceae bacterium]
MTEDANKEILLDVRNLKKVFPAKRGAESIRAIDGLSFKINKGETYGLVGESGCGKTTTGRTIARLYKPTEGQIWFGGTDIGKSNKEDLKPFRKKIQMIFQDPYGSLNPRMTIGEIVGEPIVILGMETKKSQREMVCRLLRCVGLSESHADRYPHEFSGGQRQRIGIARAIAVNPEMIICDEPVSALDPSIQAQVINMLMELQERDSLTYLFIAHDISIVKHISSTIGVMHMGKIVEQATAQELYRNPAHPYTRALLSAVPLIKLDGSIVGNTEVANMKAKNRVEAPGGCSYRNRCPIAKEICENKIPGIKDIGGGHLCACHALY